MIGASYLQQLQGNYVFVVGFWAWFAAQFAKVHHPCRLAAPGPGSQHTELRPLPYPVAAIEFALLPADIHEKGERRGVGRHSHRGFWRHAIVTLLAMHGELGSSLPAC